MFWMAEEDPPRKRLLSRSSMEMLQTTRLVESLLTGMGKCRCKGPGARVGLTHKSRDGYRGDSKDSVFDYRQKAKALKGFESEEK